MKVPNLTDAKLTPPKKYTKSFVVDDATLIEQYDKLYKIAGATSQQIMFGYMLECTKYALFKTGKMKNG
jgi:hypothetical protein